MLSAFECCLQRPLRPLLLVGLVATSLQCNSLPSVGRQPGDSTPGASNPPATGSATGAPKAQPEPRIRLKSPPSSVGGRCVVPTPETPPPTASPPAHCPADPTGPLALERVSVTFIEAPGRPTVNVEHAETQEQKTRGLMYRTSMDAQDGMLFSWREATPRSFWMKNTCLSLDMLFIAPDGTIAGILEHVPPLNLLARRVPCPAQYVLEMNAGWARAAGVKAGQRVQLSL